MSVSLACTIFADELEKMTAYACRQQLSEHLFWDVIREEVDMEKHALFITQRVLEYGTLEDWHLLRSYYGIEHIVEMCKSMRALDPVCLSFICAISQSKKEDFRCYHTRLSNPTPWNS